MTGLVLAAAASCAAQVSAPGQLSGTHWLDREPAMPTRSGAAFSSTPVTPERPGAGRPYTAAESVFRRLPDVIGLPPSFRDAVPGGEGVATDPGAGGGGQRGFEQPPNCQVEGFRSNASFFAPTFVYDDFIATSDPIDVIEFYGGSTNLVNDCGFSGFLDITIEIQTIQPGGACGWANFEFVYGATFDVASLNPVFHCVGPFNETHYRMRADMGGIRLNAGQNYLLTIIGRHVDPNSNCLFFWTASSQSHFNPSSTYHWINQNYTRCGPDVAFTINPGDGVTCQPPDCAEPHPSNINSNTFLGQISSDDFVGVDNEELQHVRWSGGVYDHFHLTSCLPAETLDGFIIEVYTAGPALTLPTIR